MTTSRQLLESARALRGVWRERPDYISEAGVGDWDAAMDDAVDRMIEAALAAYDETMPRTLTGLIPWLALRNPMREHPSFGRLGDGPRAFATSGHGLLVVEDAGDAGDPVSHGVDWPGATESIGKLLDGIGGETISVGTAWLSDLATKRRVIVGDAVLDARLVHAFVSLPHLVAPCDALRVTYDCDVSAVRFASDGWTSVVMPTRSYDEIADDLIVRIGPGARHA